MSKDSEFVTMNVEKITVQTRISDHIVTEILTFKFTIIITPILLILLSFGPHKITTHELYIDIVNTGLITTLVSYKTYISSIETTNDNHIKR